MLTETISHLHLREQVIKQIRSYLDSRGFHEIVPTVLNSALPLEPTLYAFETKNHYYLPTSPESSLKKYLSITSEKCYSISPSFRALEVEGPLHVPEFLMLEVYEPGSTYQDMIHLSRDLILSLLHPSSWDKSWPILSLIDLFLRHTSLNLLDLLDEKKIDRIVKNLGYKNTGATWEQLFNQIFLNEIEPHLPKEPFFLTDYPARISPLAAVQKENSHFAERFELYINGIELANGNTENLNTKAVQQSMEIERIYRQKNNLPTNPIDHAFLKAISQLPNPTAGFGLGLDRLTMLINGQTKLPNFKI